MKANYVTTQREGCPNLKAPPNVEFFSLFLEDAPLRSFVASHIPRFFVRSKKWKEREKMSTLRGVGHFRGPGGRNRDSFSCSALVLPPHDQPLHGLFTRLPAIYFSSLPFLAHFVRFPFFDDSKGFSLVAQWTQQHVSEASAYVLTFSVKKKKKKKALSDGFSRR